MSATTIDTDTAPTDTDTPDTDTDTGADDFIAESDNGFQLWKQQARQSALSEVDKGRRFEKMMVKFLSAHPQFKERFNEVMLWSDWVASLPEGEREFYASQDLGIDLVGIESGIANQYLINSLCAIQCKFYADDTTLNKKSIDSFLGALNIKGFQSGILCHTANDVSNNIWKALSQLSKSVIVLDSEAFRDKNFTWSGYDEHAEVSYRTEPHSMRRHQVEAKAAWDECVDDKARITLPCGSGKTLLACRIAEDNRRVLVLVPSISLISQSIKEFSRERATDKRHSYLAVCSDRTVGYTEDKQRIYELTVPATTNPDYLRHAMTAKLPEGDTSVVFATYQSIGVVREAQQQGAPAFDVVICDEAHRTTGLAEIADDDDTTESESTPFKRICEPDYIKHGRKLFMTATPIVYADSEADRAAKHGKRLYSMEDTEVYGEEIYHYSFADAIDDGVLCDYQVLIAAVEPDQYRELLANPFPYTYTETDKAGKDKETKGALPKEETSLMLGLLEAVATKGVRSAITFAGIIKKSKSYRNAMPSLLSHYNAARDGQPPVRVEVRHVDGEDSAAYRSQQLRWLGEDDGTAKILSNAQCLSEGVDVPALDAVAFLTPRASVRECVQAVGRVMRTAPDKTLGTVIIPLVISSDEKVETADDVILRKQSLKVLVSVLQALRSHDERLNRELNKGDASRFDYVLAGERITAEQADRFDPEGDNAREQEKDKAIAQHLPLDWVAVASKVSLYLIEQLSSDRYWGDWAEDIAAIYTRLEKVIRRSVKAETNAELLAEFRAELDLLTGQKLDTNDFVALLSAHTITVPLFEAIYPDYDILHNSSAAAGIQAFLTETAGDEIATELALLKPIIDTITDRAGGIKDPAKRAEMTKSIYERLLFAIMFDKAISKGVGYSPIPVVDFLIRSSDDLMRRHFNGLGITDENVVVYEPFAGTSSFISRMIGMENLIDGKDLRRKYEHEIYTQELLILPYYAGDLAVEEAFMARTGERRNFTNSIFGDTFTAHQRDKLFDPNTFQKFDADDTRASNELREKSVTLFISNPPFTAGKRKAEEGAANVTYEKIEAAMDATYGRNKGKSLKTQWAKAMRFATDRIDDEAGGMISYVIPSTWLRSVDARGFRQSVAEEFDAIYVLDCLGGFRGFTSEESERHGESIFGGDGLRGIGIPVALCVFVRLPSAERNGSCVVNHREIGGYLDRGQKYDWLKNANSMTDIEGWEKLNPDARYDWFDKINPDYEKLIPLGNDLTKRGKEETAIFRIYSLGLKTGEDERAVNSSRDVLRPIIQAQQAEFNEMSVSGDLCEPTSFRQSRDVMKNIERGKRIPVWDEEMIRHVWHRPFFWQNTRFQALQDSRHYKTSSLYPKSSSENISFSPGLSGTSMMTLMLSDLNSTPRGRNFYSLHAYDEDGTLRKNITDYALNLFQTHYADKSISKEDIFYYAFGSLNRNAYRNKWANSLKSKSLRDLRIELLPDFWRQSARGRTLAEASRLLDFRLPKPLNLPSLDFSSDNFLIGGAKMKDDRAGGTLAISSANTASGLPDEMWEWEYNSRSIMWSLMNRWKITTTKNLYPLTDNPNDEPQPIQNDPNDLFTDPQCQVAHFGEWLERCAQFSRVAVRIDRELDDNGVVDVSAPLA